jgi:hypothetical protein
LRDLITITLIESIDETGPAYDNDERRVRILTPCIRIHRDVETCTVRTGAVGFKVVSGGEGERDECGFVVRNNKHLNFVRLHVHKPSKYKINFALARV